MVSKIKRIGYILVCTILVVFFHTACNSTGSETETPPTGYEEQKEYIDILSAKWSSPHMEEPQQSEWDVIQYIPVNTIAPNEDSIFRERKVLFYQGYFYELVQWENQDTNPFHQYQLYSINLQTKEETEVMLDSSEWLQSEGLENGEMERFIDSIEEGYARITSFDAGDDCLQLFFTVSDEEWIIRHFYLVTVTLEGNFVGITDYTDSICQDGAEEDRVFEEFPEFIYGKDGGIYAIDGKQQTLKIVNHDGEIVATEAIEVIPGNKVRCIGKSVDGTPVFSGMFQKGIDELFFMDESGKHLLFRNEIENVNEAIDLFGNVLMLQGDKLCLWNVIGGEYDEIYHLNGLDAYSCMGIDRMSDGDIFLCFEEGEEMFLYRLSHSVLTDKQELVLLSPSEDDYITKCVAAYNRSHPGTIIRIEMLEQQAGYEWSKLLEKMGNGDGPDLLNLNRTQLELLQEKDALCSLKPYLESETLENIFDGVLKFGEIDSELYALPYRAGLSVWMVDSKNWEKPDWSLEQMLDACHMWNQRYTDAEILESMHFRPDADQILYDFCVSCIEYSDFLDMKAMKCDFTNDTFYELLRFCLQYGKASAYDEGYIKDQELINEVRNNKSFLYSFAGGLIKYSNARKSLGDDYHTVGFPSKTGVVGGIECYWGVAISAQSKNRELAIDFLNFLVNEKNQRRYTVDWIRRDVLEKNVKDAPQMQEEGKGNTPLFEIDAYGYVPLAGRADGTSYLDEYLLLMEEAVPLSTEHEIQKIISEEAASYFCGDRTEYEVAEIIQNRVSVYLEENR